MIPIMNMYLFPLDVLKIMQVINLKLTFLATSLKGKRIVKKKMANNKD